MIELNAPTKPNPNPDLDDDDKTVLRRFITILDDEGVQAHLSLALLSATNSFLYSLELLDAIVDDVCDIEGVESVYLAAPSLVLLVGWIKQSEGLAIPEDFIPDAQLITRLLEAFYEEARQEATEED
ncbi:MAG TPA: hypothetical protein VK694_00570 [Verrucomicrobiae bacterium]|nr:hypothetical protein [Verrucomicrobiae bacterium]